MTRRPPLGDCRFAEWVSVFGLCARCARSAGFDGVKTMLRFALVISVFLLSSVQAKSQDALATFVFIFVTRND